MGSAPPLALASAAAGVLPPAPSSPTWKTRIELSDVIATTRSLRSMP